LTKGLGFEHSIVGTSGAWRESGEVYATSEVLGATMNGLWCWDVTESPRWRMIEGGWLRLKIVWIELAER